MKKGKPAGTDYSWGVAAFAAGMVVLLAGPVAALLWRIRIEERALATALGDRYRVYAVQHKRLVPLVW